MKKYASALAVAAALAVPSAAMANVSISGYVSAGVSQWDYDTDSANDGKEMHLEDGRSSRIRFSGAEEIGNGLTAEFMMETRFSPDLGNKADVTSPAAGATWVGLGGDFGKIRAGRIDLYYLDSLGLEVTRATTIQSWSSFSLLSGAADTDRTLFVKSRYDNVIRYDSPSFGGFSGSAAYSFNANGAEGTAASGGKSDGTYYLAARYAQGPIFAGVSYIDIEGEGNDNETKAWRVYGSYTLPFGLKIGAAVDQLKWDMRDTGGDKNDRLAWSIPLTYKTGAHAVYATYGEARDTDQGDNDGAKYYSLGYDYALSNRTTVGANWTVMDNDDNGGYGLFLQGANNTVGLGGGTPAEEGMKTQQIYFGIAHVF